MCLKALNALFIMYMSLHIMYITQPLCTVQMTGIGSYGIVRMNDMQNQSLPDKMGFLAVYSTSDQSWVPAYAEEGRQ